MKFEVTIYSKIRQTQKEKNHVLFYMKNQFFKYKNGMGTIWRREGGEEEELVDRQKE